MTRQQDTGAVDRVARGTGAGARSSRLGLLLGLAAASAAYATTARALPSEQTVGPTGSLAAVCVGNDFGTTDIPGYLTPYGTSFTAGSAPLLDQQDCSYKTGGVTGTGSGLQLNFSGSYGGSPSAVPLGTYSNVASAQASVAAVHLVATSQGSNDTSFAGAEAQGGFNITTTPAGGATGTQGIWTVPIVVDGNLSTSGPWALALAEVAVFANGQEVTTGTPVSSAAYNKWVATNSAFDPSDNTTQTSVGNVTGTPGYELKVFRADSGTNLLGGYGPDSLSVSTTILFQIPVTFGTPITLGVYGLVEATEASSDLDTTANAPQALFQDTFAWGGEGYITPVDSNGVADGSPITDFPLVVGGIDFNQSFAAPEPAGTAVLSCALAALGWLRRGRRRVRPG